MKDFLILGGLIVFFLAPAITIGANDQSRGGAKVAWVVLGLVFSWLAVMLWAIVTEGKAGRYECDECRELIRYKAKICPFCRTVIENPRADPLTYVASKRPPTPAKKPAT